MNFMYLIKLVISREEREEWEDLKEDTADAPVVHFVIIVAIREQALRRSVPPRGNVLSERGLAVHASARSEIRQLHLIILNQDVLAK
jgi:hypothetical protein